MLVLGINKILNWCQITSGGRKYTYPIKMIDNVLYFRFKKKWYKVIEHTGEHTAELIEEGGKIISKKFFK